MLRVHHTYLASSRCQGERRMKDTDHDVVHLVVHLANHRSGKETKRLGMTPHRIRARRGDRLGLERPHCSARGRAQRDSWGRSSPTRP